MRFKRHIELEKGRLDIAPLIDVVFLLLIFFMLTSGFISRQGIRVNLPSAATAKALPGEDLIVSINSKDQLIIEDKKISIKELGSKIESAAKDKNSIMIKADKKASLGRVVEVWDLCRDGGITNINIGTAPKE